ncbi:MAG TPA: transcriptional regulator [Gammaproteobacteria bacterium]|nr:transcriptional regulator [Gammaproteobacteria bacterium]
MNAQAHIDMAALLPAWEIFQRQTGIAPIHDEAHYQRMVALLDALLATVDGQEQHPIMGLIDIVGDLVEDYEAEYHALPMATGIQALRFLMEQHNLQWSDLPELGHQNDIMEILSGRRELNSRQAHELAQRFSVSPATFIGF